MSISSPRAALRLAALLLATLLCGCASLSTRQIAAVDAKLAAARPDAVQCERLDNCARPSELHALAGRAHAESTPDAPRHYTLLLERGSDALLARVDLIRSATTRIDLQTYIFDEDDAGRFVLDELVAAAQRGVRVRVLMDQLSALRRVESLAALAGVHANFEARVYNPVLHRARIGYPQYVWAGICCWGKLNQRMHNKLLLVDGAVGISGGRNYQDDYYDWDAEYNFRDRDIVIAGPAARDMQADFDRYWQDTRAVPVQHLSDVGRHILDGGVPALPAAGFKIPARVQAASALAEDPQLVRERLLDRVLPVGAVEYVADPPGKRVRGAGPTPASAMLQELILSARERVMLQTPYLVLSDTARRLFHRLRGQEPAPRILVSTNSLAATDAFIAYALSHKYKRRYLRDLNFEIFEYKPFPEDAPIDVATTGAPLTPPPPAPTVQRDRRSVLSRTPPRRVQPLAREFAALAYGSRRAVSPVPLKRAGVRMGLHAKSLVIDDSVGVVGTHNFDPRGDTYNTEAMVVIRDPRFAAELAASLARDMAPANAWTIAPREKPPVLSGLNYSLGKLSEKLPVFDLWPFRYATSFEFRASAQCPAPVPMRDARFYDCYAPVGDFPEVDLGLKGVLTRIVTGFGAGLAPIL